MSIEKISKVVNDNGQEFITALGASQTGSLLIPVGSTVGAKGAGEVLPPEEQFSEENAPTVVLVVRATPDAHENVSALLARYRGDDPKAGIKPKEEKPK